MQNQVRFYITQTDDHAVVRTIPVKQVVVAEQDAVIQAPVVVQATKPVDRLKGSKLMRTAAKLNIAGK